MKLGPQHLAVWIVAAAMPAAAEESAAAQAKLAPQWGATVSTGLDYSSGKYGASAATKVLVVPFSATVKYESLRFAASVPYVSIDGPAGVVIGPDGKPVAGVSVAGGVRQGLGDLSLSATQSLPSDQLGGLAVDLTGRIKLPTSNKSQHLGTGATDFSASADLSYAIGDWSPFVTLGYEVPGKVSGLNLRNGADISVGTSVILGKAIAVFSYDYSQAISATAKDGQELFAALSGPLTDRVNLTGYGSAGLSAGSPDFGVGVMVSLKLR